MAKSPKERLVKLSLILRRLLASNLRFYRGERSQAEIAQKAGVGWRNYARLERLERGGNVTLDNLARIAKALGVTPAQLITRRESHQQEDQ